MKRILTEQEKVQVLRLKDVFMWIRFLIWCFESGENLEGREVLYADLAITLLERYKDYIKKEKT